MRDRIKSAAEAAGRSMNAEIVQRLQTSLDGGDLEALMQNVLPAKVYSALEVAAAIHCVSLKERLVQILAGSLNVETELDRLGLLAVEVGEKNVDLEDQIEDLRNQINFELFGHYTRVAQMNTLLRILEDQHKADLGPVTAQIVSDMLDLNSKEVELLQDRLEVLQREGSRQRKRRQVGAMLERPSEEAEGDAIIDKQEWDWENGKADKPPTVDKLTQTPGKRQKR
jgi:plasmid stability protein